MGRGQPSIVIPLRLLTEFVITLLAWIVTYELLGPITGKSLLRPFDAYVPTTLIFALASLSLASLREFIQTTQPDLSDDVRHHFVSSGCSLIVVIMALYLFRSQHLSRLLLLSATCLNFLVLAVWAFLRHRYHWIAHRRRRVLVIGHGGNIPELVASVESTSTEFELVGYLSTELNDPDLSHLPARNLGSPTDLEIILDTQVVDIAIFGIYRQDPATYEKLMLACYERGLNVWIKPDLMAGTHISRIDHIRGIPLLVFYLGPVPGLALVIKRLIDVVGSLIALILLALPMAILALVIRMNSPGPALFTQVRVGLNGRRFNFYKFRTMVADHETAPGSYALKNEMDGPVFKMTSDPRVTTLGRFLRKHSLDELPQLWNTLLGDMSLVGPRPPLPHEVDQYKGWHRRRLSMRPGLTCLWQVTDRNKVESFAKWVELDLQYIDQWSLWLDFQIMFWTLGAVFRGTGV